MEQRAGVAKIGLSAERQIGHSHSADILCTLLKQSVLNRVC